MKKTVLFGDSLTAGRIGIAYRRYIPLPTEVHGIEGDTWLGVMKRVHRYVKAKHPGRQTSIVLQSGANDLLLPHMAKRYTPWSMMVGSSETGPIQDDQLYEEAVGTELERLMEALGDTVVVLCSIPILGEDLDSELNVQRRIRNGIMKSVADAFSHVVWCDLAAPLEQLVLEKQGSSTYLPERPSDLADDVAYIGTDEAKAASISKERGLIVTIDGIHPNALGAQTIAETITAVLPW